MDLEIFDSLKSELPRRVQDIVDGVGSIDGVLQQLSSS